MNSFNKVIAPPQTNMVSGINKPLPICTSWNQIQTQEDINASIMIPGNISSQNKKCFEVSNLQNTFDKYRDSLNNNINYSQPSNKEFNLAKLMNMRFDAVRDGNYMAATRFQHLINDIEKN